MTASALFAGAKVIKNVLVDTTQMQTQPYLNIQVQIMLFAIIFKTAFFKKQPKHFRLSSGSDLTGSDLTIKTELFVLKKVDSRTQ